MIDASSLCHTGCLKSIEYGPNMMRLYIKALVDMEGAKGKCTGLLVENVPFIHVGKEMSLIL